ncbi:unnamed protein product [Allacma fusca]|uniref:Cytochrome P450 n=1 Tax=Allacma fusca TaxID=39272 RepID=A0A8J2MFG1_9HEXA|nr:unnamed protein product [Allacma fusca]
MTLTVLLFVFLLCCLVARNFYFTKRKLPPALWGLPIFGNIHWFVAANPGKILLNIGKKRGPVVFTTVGSFNTVILNGQKAVKEGCKFMPLNKRPDSVYKTLADNHGYLFSDDNVEYRKFIFRYFKYFGLDTQNKEKMIHEEINNVFLQLDQCLGKPQEVRNMFSVATLNVIFYVILSKRYDPGDPDLIPIIKSVNYLSEMPNILTRGAILMPWITKVMPSISGHHFMMGMVLDLFLELENLFDEHCTTRVPNEPRDMSDAYVDKYGRTTFISHVSGSPQNLWPIVITELFVGAIETTNAGPVVNYTTAKLKLAKGHFT